MELRVERIDHLYITVSDLPQSEQFYDPVMQVLGFRKGTRPIAGEPHVHYFNRAMQYSLRPARRGERADPYGVGALHHLCFQLSSLAEVDEAQRRLRELGVQASEPALYPEYRPDYYASFFEDPDGIRLELVADSAGRRLIRERWHELTDFVDPVPRLLERDAARLQPSAADIALPNLFETEPPAQGETFRTLAQLGSTTIEQIVSSAEPAAQPSVQDHDEWVVVLRGRAELDVNGRRLELREGDQLAIAAGTPHQVLATSAGTMWLAVHVGRAN
jgi:glyoxylase I family protein